MSKSKRCEHPYQNCSIWYMHPEAQKQIYGDIFNWGITIPECDFIRTAEMIAQARRIGRNLAHIADYIWE